MSRKGNELKVYCKHIKCPHVECLRHHKYMPWNEVVIERNYKPDKEWNCKDILKEE